MDILAIDIGNSEIKSALVDNDYSVHQFIRSKYVKHSIDSSLSEIINRYDPDLKKWTVVSNEDMNIELMNSFTGLNFINDKTSLPLEIDYYGIPGRDRICDLAGAMLYDHDKTLVIDMGTATTFNLLIGKNFTGGLILPGIKTSLEYLSHKTGLPITDITGDFTHIGKDTYRSVTNGVYQLNKFGLTGIINEYKSHYKGLYVILTGGMSYIFRNDKLPVDIFDEHLSLKGLKIISDKNENSN